MADDTANSNAGKVRGRPFQKGQVANPAGRPKGSRNKLNEDFVRMLSDDFAQHGEDVISKVRSEKPDIYLRVVASLSPKHVELKDERLDDLERDELAALLDATRQARAAREATREGPVH